MEPSNFFYNCSREYIDSINSALHIELVEILKHLPKRPTQTDINNDFFWLLTERGWSYDTLAGISETLPNDLHLEPAIRRALEQRNNRSLCETSSTLEATWHSDFGKRFGSSLVQIEVQFGKVESMFKDFCGFRIARYERRLALGIEIVMTDPAKYFEHRKSSISGMAYFEIARRTLPAIELNCPIWLIGLRI